MKCKNCGMLIVDGSNDIRSKITFDWFIKLFESIDNLSLDTKKGIIKGCSIAHYNALNMDNVLNSYIGDVYGFIKFIESEWNWLVEINEDEKVIYADENKPNCVCPIVELNSIKSSLICNCSEGFAEKMFSKILQQDVSAKVTRSVLRGDKSCVYEIKWG